MYTSNEKLKELQFNSGFEAVEHLKRLSFIVNELDQHFKLNKDKKVLEIGCGNGRVCKAIASQGYKVKGVDIDNSSIELAKSTNDFPNLEFEAIPAEKLDTRESFDAIVCTEVLEHLAEPEVVLEFAKNRLNPNGVLITTVPNGKGPREVLMTQPMQYLEKKNLGKALQKVKNSMGYGYGTPQSSNPNLEHIQFFSKKEIILMHKKHGFKLKTFKKSDSIRNVFPYSLLTKKIRPLEKLDCKIADFLPTPLVSGFYMSYTIELSSN
jgi:2-polyprenyl-3-methyl-5-hydroxy-6-metoxy-1,4-benzoquinol methylase